MTTHVLQTRWCRNFVNIGGELTAKYLQTIWKILSGIWILVWYLVFKYFLNTQNPGVFWKVIEYFALSLLKHYMSVRTRNLSNVHSQVWSTDTLIMASRRRNRRHQRRELSTILSTRRTRPARLQQLTCKMSALRRRRHVKLQAPVIAYLVTWYLISRVLFEDKKSRAFIIHGRSRPESRPTGHIAVNRAARLDHHGTPCINFVIVYT